MDEQQAVTAVAKAVKGIDEAYFSAWPGGWPEQIGTALIDAVYSIRANYHAKDPAKGVLNRVRAFREIHPKAANDLELLRSLGEEAIRDIMGNGKSSGRYKSACVIEAAENLLSLDLPVRHAANLVAPDRDHQRAYTSVHGLGWVTYEYFTMLLGQPGIKADTMVRRFVDTTLREQGLPSVDVHTAKRLLETVHASERPLIGLHEFDHAIWLHQRTISKNQK